MKIDTVDIPFIHFSKSCEIVNVYSAWTFYKVNCMGVIWDIS